MNDDMYIRFDDTGISVSSSRAEFDKTPMRLMELDDVSIGRGITVNSFYNLKFIAFVMILASVPLVYGINDAFPSVDEVRAERNAQIMKKVAERCAKPNVEKVLVTTLGVTKTINCGEVS
jgi:hypothetical protein